MKTFWLKYRHVIIAIAVAAGFSFAAYKVSPLAAGLSAASSLCVAVALKLFKKEA